MKKTNLIFKSIVISLCLLLLGFPLFWNNQVHAENESLSDFSLVYMKPSDETSQNGRRTYGLFTEEGKPYIITDTATPTKKNFKKQLNLPSSYDLRTGSFLTSVKDQLSTSTCWAFSAIGAMESNMMKNNLWGSSSEPDLSELHLAWFIYTPVTDPTNPLYGDSTNFIQRQKLKSPNLLDWGGFYQLPMAALASWQGATSEENMPFTQYKSTDLSAYNGKRFDSVAHLQNVNELMGTVNKQDEETINTIKSSLMTNGALTLSYYSSADSNYHLSPAGTTYYQNTYANTEGNDYSDHGVLLVGWDDNFSKENFLSGCKPPSDGAWLIRNSWGSKHGDDGYFWLSYNERTICDVVTMETEPSNNYNHNYQYDGFYVNSYLECDSNTSMANVFHLNSKNHNERLDAVSFYTINYNVSYTIRIYKNLVNGIPSNATKVPEAEMAGTISHPGYHTIKLNNPVLLENATDFAVEVMFEASINRPVLYPIESREYNGLSGQSFYYSNGTWLDLRTKNLYNVPIKAFTTNLESTTIPIPTKIPISTPKPSPTSNPSKKPLFTFNVPTKKITVGVGETYSLKNTKHPILSINGVSLQSTNTNIALVSSSGLLTAKKTGRVSITATTATHKNTIIVLTIKSAPKKFKLNASSKTLRPKKLFQIKVKSYSPKASASYKLRYVTNKKKIASVSATGKVVAKRRGIATITVRTYNNKKATLKLRVK